MSDSRHPQGEPHARADAIPLDLLGHPVTETEQLLLDVYERLKKLAGRDDFAPCAQHNVRKALACLWQVTNDLDLQFEQLYDLGV